MSYHDKPYSQTFQKDNRNQRVQGIRQAGKRHNKLEVYQRELRQKKKDERKQKGQVDANLYPEEELAIVKRRQIEKVYDRKPNRQIQNLRKKKDDFKEDLREEKTKKINKKISKV